MDEDPRARGSARARALARRRLRQARPERAPLKLEDVIAAAFRLIDQDGLQTLTMRKLADELGIQAASLYWHVRDKHELIDLLADALFAEFDLGDLPETGGDWRANLWTFGNGFRGYLKGRRDGALILVNRFVPSPHLLSHLERLLGWLRGSGLPDREAAYGLFTTMVFVHGFVLWETTPMSAQVARGEAPSDYLDEVREELEDLPEAAYPHTVALAGYLTGPSNDARFEFGLKCLLDGMEGHAERTL